MNSEKLQKWALLAEILGGLAVVITLIFLVLETRSNTDAIRAQTFQTLNYELNESRRLGIDEEFGLLRMRYLDGEFDSFTRNEELRIRSYIFAVWGIYESAFYARERNILGDEEWARFDLAICRNKQREVDLWDGLTITLTPRFVEYVVASCE